MRFDRDPTQANAVLVLGHKKQVEGVVVLNVMADHLLKNILSRETLNGAVTYLLNRDGYYLLHLEVAKQWGSLSDLNTGENVKSDMSQETATLVLAGKIYGINSSAPSGCIFISTIFMGFKPHAVSFCHLRSFVLLCFFC